uniref:Putative tick transposon n=1 Tax=Ixodes ricinus TaxID=34613 RepID=A0A6B0V4W8_IXORI
MAFTRMSMKIFPLVLAGKLISYASQHTFLGFTLDRNLTWTPHIKQLRKKIHPACHILRSLTGRSWGKSSYSMLRLQNSTVNGLLRYSLPVLHTCASNMKNLQAGQNKSLRLHLGLPPDSPTIPTLAEAGQCPLEILRIQEILLMYLRYKTQHRQHHLLNAHLRCLNAEISSHIALLQHDIPQFAVFSEAPHCPPWILPPPIVSSHINGVENKSSESKIVLLQYTYTH